jgi:nucleoside-diphosphate-sugar epimerase
MTAAARRTGRSVYVGDGETVTSAMHVDAAADAYLAALDRGEAGAVYHVGSDEEPTLRQIAEAVALATAARAESVSGDEAAALIDPFTAMFTPWQSGVERHSRA